MKHKLTVLACIGLALLLTSGTAFAQNTVTVVGGPLARCAAGQAVQVEVTNASALGAIGLPLTISGGATITGAVAGAALTGAGFSTAVGGFPGAAGVLNAVGGNLAPGVSQSIWTLSVSTPATCGGAIVIDTAFFPPAGAFLLGDASCCAAPQPGFNAGAFTLVNQSPICGANSNESVNFTGSVNKQLNASDPDACDNPLSYALVSIAPAVSGAAAVSPSGLFTYSATCADKGAHTVTFSATDACGASENCTFTLTVTNDAPVCGANSDENVYFQTQIGSKQLNASDPNSNPITYSLVSIAPANVGAASVSASGVFSYATVCGDVGTHTVTFRVSDGCDSTNCTFQVTVFQNAPVATCPADASVDWDAANSIYTLNAIDDACISPLSWILLDVTPASQNIPTVSGNALTFNPDCADFGKGPMAIRVRVSDGEKADTCSFNITVTNAKPAIDCPDNQFAVLGDHVDATVTATDAAGNALNFYLVSFTGLEGQGAPTNAPTVSASGEFDWQTSSATSNDAGAWEACVRVADGCGQEDTCCWVIDVLAYALCIRSDLDSANIHVLNGMTATAYVTLSNTYPLGGIDLLICYDPSGLSFLDAFCVDELCDWEYFTWRHSPSSNCEGGCPSGYIRIVAIADLDNGPSNHPDPASFYLDGKIVGLNFAVTSDRNFIHQCLNIGFCTLDCGDNALSSKSGDTLFIPIGADQSCIDPTKQVARDIIEFCPGRICIDEPPDDRGDINLNGVAHEVGDAVLFTNYFIHGSSVWTPPYQNTQILATDINDDGVVLTVADLIYLIRVITGDEQPFPPNPKVSPYASSGTATMHIANNSVTVQTSSSVELGGALLVFRYSNMSVGAPALLDAANGMNLRYSAVAGELRVLVHPSWTGEMAAIGTGTNEILSIPTTGDGTIELVEVQMSDRFGALMSTNAAKTIVPTEYALMQNYPNPFNAGTVMSFDLKDGADWTLTVFNVTGQTVREFAGSSEIGRVDVTWDGRDANGNAAASGVYFYRVNANGFNATKKMTLVK